LPEIVRDGVDGFFADDVAALAAAVGRVGELDRAAIRASVIDRFSSGRMADGYEAIYRQLIAPTESVRVAANGGRPTG
jgi:glycosyltransferase involved in cell wall biosynthesis